MWFYFFINEFFKLKLLYFEYKETEYKFIFRVPFKSITRRKSRYNISLSVCQSGTIVAVNYKKERNLKFTSYTYIGIYFSENQKSN